MHKSTIKPQFTVPLLTSPLGEQLSLNTLANAEFMYDTGALCNINHWDRILYKTLN
jgi:hypothetical protein